MNSSSQDNIIQQYDRITGGADLVSKENYEFIADGWQRWLTDWLPTDPDATCLDLGCGFGIMVYLLKRRRIRQVTGVDLCAGELDAARKVLEADLIQQDILEYLKSRPAQSLDFISAMNIFEHLSLDTLLAVVAECRRTLRPGGSLVGMVPNATSPFGGMTRYWDLTHHTAFTPSSLRHVANATGFDVTLLSFRECGPRIHGVKSLVRVALWRAIRQVIKLHLLVETASTKSGIYTADMLFRMRVAQS